MRTGRPAFKVTDDHRRQVRELAAKGLSQRDAARIIGCALETFRKHFRDEFLAHSKIPADVQEPAPPPVRITPQQRVRVQRLKYAKMSDEDIAAALDMELDFLAQHFAKDLKIGAAKTRAEVVEMMYESAEAGNVQARKRLLEMASEGDGSASAGGKKEQRAEAAKKASTGKFAPPAPPKLVVNND